MPRAGAERKEREETEAALTALVRLLARQAAREAVVPAADKKRRVDGQETN